MVTRGDYCNKNGKHYITYDEVMEGFSEHGEEHHQGISQGSVDIIKRGITSAHMQFEKDKRTCAATPPPWRPGHRNQTNKIRIDEREDSLKVNVEYSLDINYQHASDCSIMVDVQSVRGASVDTVSA